MATQPIDFSDLGAKPVQAATAAPPKVIKSVDFSDLGAKQVAPAPAPSENQTPEQPGAFQRGLSSLLDNTVGTHTNEGVIEGFTKGIPQIAKHPIDSAGMILDAEAAARQRELEKAAQLYQQPGIANKIGGMARHLYGAVPFLGPAMGALADKFEQGDYAGGTTGTIGLAAMMGTGSPEAQRLAGSIADRAAAVPGVVKNAGRGMLADRMSRIPEGERFTRQQVLDAARAKGVNLDLADATGSGAVSAIKKGNSVSIAGKGVLEDNAAKNVSALEKWANSEASTYAPEAASSDVLGGQVQSTLSQDLATKKAAAAEAFDDLDKRVGSIVIDGTGTVEREARSIVSGMKEYYLKHPELKPKQAWSIVENLADRPKVLKVNPNATAPGLMDAQGQPFYTSGTVTRQPSGVHNFTWTELHQLRSDLMDVYRNNPDIIKGKSEAWLQRMVGTIDRAMTDSAGGLSGPDLARFRQANAAWENIKDTYDNPRSPLYHAVRSQFPSQVPGMLSRPTPELAAQVRSTLGSLEGPFQRQFVENILNDKSGTLDLKNLNSRLSRVSDEHLEAMIGKEGAKNLRLLGKVAAKVTADVNSSGTAKAMVPFGEISGFLAHPVLGATELATSYGTARAMTSPRMIDYLTRPGQKAVGMRPQALRGSRRVPLVPLSRFGSSNE